MDDPWGSNAWSTSSIDEQDILKRPNDHPRWNSFERDADEDTVDVAAPSWAITAVEPAWDGGMNLWNASSSTLDVWKPKISESPANNAEDGVLDEQEVQVSEEVAQEEAEESRVPTPKPTLPTPPLSPAPYATALSHSPSLEEQLALPDIHPTSPDPFGSFESGQYAIDEAVRPIDDSATTWSRKAATFPSEDAEEPWGTAWGGEVEAGGSPEPVDEWEAAQEAKRRRDRKVPPELLQSILDQWEKLSDNVYGERSAASEASFSWRKGLDNVEGLSELVEKFLPQPSFPPPPPLSKSQLSRSVRETLRLTRSFALTQSSPMSRLYASKGSMEWERSVKSQKSSANDEWGWDLKHDIQDNSDDKDDTKDKKSTGFLSFWNRKPSSTPSVSQAAPAITPTSPAMNPPTSATKPSSSPIASPIPSIDVSIPTFAKSPTTPESSTIPPTVVSSTESVQAETASTQPSAVSRFWNRFSKRSSIAVPTSPSEKETERRSSLQVALSADELSFLSDIVPTGSASKSQHTAPSVDSLEAILTSTTRGSSAKLPAPLAPPPPPSILQSTPKSPPSNRSSSSFDLKMTEAKFLDTLENAGFGVGEGRGYSAVTSVNLLDSPLEEKYPLPTTSNSSFNIPTPPLPLPLQPLSTINPMLSSNQQGLSRSATPNMAPSASVRLNQTSGLSLGPSLSTQVLSSDLFSLPKPISPIPPPALPIPTACVHNPLPPTPKPVSMDGFDDFADFISGPSLASTSSASTPSAFLTQSHETSSSPAFGITNTSLSMNDANFAKPTAANAPPSLSSPMPSMSRIGGPGPAEADFDFGDFISTPSPPPQGVSSDSPKSTISQTISPRVPSANVSLASPTLPRSGNPGRAGNITQLVTSASNKVGRWPAPPSPGLPRLQPPPGSSNLLLSSEQRPPADLLGEIGINSDSITPSLPLQRAAAPISLASFVPPSSHFTSQSRSVTPLMPNTPPSSTSQRQGSGKSGLSAQDISFFEGL